MRVSDCLFFGVTKSATWTIDFFPIQLVSNAIVSSLPSHENIRIRMFRPPDASELVWSEISGNAFSARDLHADANGSENVMVTWISVGSKVPPYLHRQVERAFSAIESR